MAVMPTASKRIRIRNQHLDRSVNHLQLMSRSVGESGLIDYAIRLSRDEWRKGTQTWVDRYANDVEELHVPYATE